MPATNLSVAGALPEGSDSGWLTESRGANKLGGEPRQLITTHIDIRPGASSAGCGVHPQK